MSFINQALDTNYLMVSVKDKSVEGKVCRSLLLIIYILIIRNTSTKCFFIAVNIFSLVNSPHCIQSFWKMQGFMSVLVLNFFITCSNIKILMLLPILDKTYWYVYKIIELTRNWEKNQKISKHSITIASDKGKNLRHLSETHTNG